MTTTTLAGNANATVNGLAPLHDVGMSDLKAAEAHTADVLEQYGTGSVEAQNAATHEMNLADMYVAGHGEADLDAAAHQQEAEMEAEAG